MSVNAINGIKGGLGASYANGIIAEFSAEASADSAPGARTRKKSKSFPTSNSTRI